MAVKAGWLQNPTKVGYKTKFFRSVASYTRLDKKHNTDVQDKQNVYNTNDKIAEYRQNWYNYVQ